MIWGRCRGERYRREGGPPVSPLGRMPLVSRGTGAWSSGTGHVPAILHLGQRAQEAGGRAWVAVEWNELYVTGPVLRVPSVFACASVPRPYPGEQSVVLR